MTIAVDGSETKNVSGTTTHNTTGAVIHRVPEMSGPRVLLRIRTGDETYQELIDKINKGTFFNV